MWTKVRDDLPPECQPVLCFWCGVPGGRSAMGVAMRSSGYWHDPENDPEDDDFAAPVAWMPLPDPPAEYQRAPDTTREGQ